MYAPRILNLTATKQPGQAAQQTINPQQAASQTIQQADKLALPGNVPLHQQQQLPPGITQPGQGQQGPQPPQQSQWQGSNYHPGQQADVSANSGAWGQQYHGQPNTTPSVMGYQAMNPNHVFGYNAPGYNTPASSNHPGTVNGAQQAAQQSPMQQLGNLQGYHFNGPNSNIQNTSAGRSGQPVAPTGQHGPTLDLSRKYYDSQPSQNNQNNSNGSNGQNQQQQQQLQPGTTISNKNQDGSFNATYRDIITNGQQYTDSEGHPAIKYQGNSYRVNGDGTLTAIVDKPGYNEDGTEQIGDPVQDRYGTTSDGRIIIYNKETGHFHVEDGKGGYVRSDAHGNPLDANGAVSSNSQTDQAGNALADYQKWLDTNKTPTLDQSKIDNLVNAERQQRAIQGGQDARSILALGANSGTNPDVTQSALSSASAQTNAAGAASDAKLQLQGEMTNLQASQDYWNQRAQAALMAYNKVTNQADKDRALQEMLLVNMQAQANKEALMRLDHQLSTMDVGSVIASGLFGLAGHALGGLAGNPGLF